MTRTFVVACLGGFLGGGLAGWTSVPEPRGTLDRALSPTNVTERAPEVTDDRSACAAKVADTLADIDALSHRYLGEPYEDRSYAGVSVLFEIERWHTWGDPAGEAA